MNRYEQLQPELDSEKIGLAAHMMGNKLKITGKSKNEVEKVFISVFSEYPHYDGYQFAKLLEEQFGWDVNSKTVNSIDSCIRNFSVNTIKNLDSGYYSDGKKKPIRHEKRNSLYAEEI